MRPILCLMNQNKGSELRSKFQPFTLRGYRFDSCFVATLRSLNPRSPDDPRQFRRCNSRNFLFLSFLSIYWTDKAKNQYSYDSGSFFLYFFLSFIGQIYGWRPSSVYVRHRSLSSQRSHFCLPSCFAERSFSVNLFDLRAKFNSEKIFILGLKTAHLSHLYHYK